MKKLKVEQLNDQYVIIHVNGLELAVSVNEDGILATLSTGEELSHDFE